MNKMTLVSLSLEKSWVSRPECEGGRAGLFVLYRKLKICGENAVSLLVNALMAPTFKIGSNANWLA